MTRKGPFFLTNIFDADGGAHLPLDDRGRRDHVAGMQCRVIEGKPVQTSYGGPRAPVARNYGPAQERRDFETYGQREPAK